MARGRPTKYRKEYCEDIVKYFSVKPYKEYKDGGGNVRRLANPLPFISSFALKIGVHHDTLLEWAKKHKHFSEALKTAKELQKNILITNGLLGLYASTFSIFTAKNIAGMRDEPIIVKESSPMKLKVANMTKEELYAWFNNTYRNKYAKK